MDGTDTQTGDPQAKTDETPGATSEPPVIQTQHAEYAFQQRVGVFDLSFYVPRGVIFGLIGPSGSGKTTTVRLLNGMYSPTKGSLEVLGQRPDRFTPATKEKIGYMPQQFVLYPMLSVMENLNFVASLYGMGIFSRGRRMRSLLKFVELDDVRNRLAGRLSGGMQRRLQLAAALVHNPQLIFADEPTSGIDPVLRDKFWEYFRALRDEGHTLFITSQYVDEIRHCDLVAIMRGGRLLYINTPDELRRKAFGGEQLRIVVDPARALEAVQILNEQPIVSDARRSLAQPGLIFVSTKDAAGALPMLIALLQERQIGMNEADQYVPPFDDVFIELMRQTGE